MNKQEALKALQDDTNYYGDFGKKYLSNSDIGTLLTNPLALGQKMANRPAFLVGGYFHTAILEPEKLKNFRIVEATTRNTKAYKEISDGEMCLLKHEVDQIDLMTEKMLSNEVCRDLIRSGNVEYEQPEITELEGQLWKGKADIVNHDEKLIIDLKTTAENTHQIGIFDCSPEFYARGKDKVERAVQAYELFYKSEDFDPKQYFLTKTL